MKIYFNQNKIIIREGAIPKLEIKIDILINWITDFIIIERIN